MDLALIAAYDRRRAIGYRNQLPWHLPDDLKRFKQLTLGAPVLMGRKTAESLGRALPGRLNLVLSRSGQAPYAGMQAVTTLEAAVAAAAAAPTLWVIGGGEIYSLCLPLAQRLYLTEVATELAAADAWFPNWTPQDWQLVGEHAHPADDRHRHPFRFLDYQRRR